jgi:hypothetical protein
MQDLNQLMWDNEILYADKSLKDEQLLLRTLLLRTKNMRGWLKVKINILFHGDNIIHCTYKNEVLQSKRSLIYLQVLFGSLFCLTKLLSIAMVQNFQFMFGHMLNHCTEFCNVIS